jgi:hypothetical protein
MELAARELKVYNFDLVEAWEARRDKYGKEAADDHTHTD